MATSQQHVPQESSVLISRYDNAVQRNARVLARFNHRSGKQDHCNLDRARKYINYKRNKTWSWQQKISLPRTRTSYAERRTHSCPYLKFNGKKWAGRADQAFRTYVELQEPANAICHVFGIYCTQALAVARCESGHSMTPRAYNGQYLGIFQMGSYARSKYGHGTTPLEQARAAYAYFVDSGRDWSPWSCKPY